MRALRRSFRFFLEHAGYRVGHHAEDALSLARAEGDADKIGVQFIWKQDDDADFSWLTQTDERGRYLFSKHEREREHEVTWCRAVLPCAEHGVDCEHAVTLASLSGIFDADQNYMRVVQAELASEAHDLITQVLTTSRANDTVRRRENMLLPGTKSFTELETLIERAGIAVVLDAIADIGHEIAEHVRANWQDDGLAKHWDDVAKRVERVASRINREGKL